MSSQGWLLGWCALGLREALPAVLPSCPGAVPVKGLASGVVARNQAGFCQGALVHLLGDTKGREEKGRGLVTWLSWTKLPTSTRYPRNLSDTPGT